MNPVYDLVVLVPGKDERATLETLLSMRCHSLGIREISYHILVDSAGHDPGCFHNAPGILRPFQRKASHALVLFDHEGSGQESRACEVVEKDVTQRVAASGWQDRARTVVVEPELEIWVWSDSPEVDRVLGWTGRETPLRDWLAQRGFRAPGATKPSRPKEALLAALREARLQRSPTVYRDLATRVSLERCADPALARLKATLCG